jgi:hypothetical protein
MHVKLKLKLKYLVKCIPQIRVSGVESSLGIYFSLEYDAVVNAEDLPLAYLQARCETTRTDCAILVPIQPVVRTNNLPFVLQCVQ